MAKHHTKLFDNLVSQMLDICKQAHLIRHLKGHSIVVEVDKISSIRCLDSTKNVIRIFDKDYIIAENVIINSLSLLAAENDKDDPAYAARLHNLKKENLTLSTPLIDRSTYPVSFIDDYTAFAWRPCQSVGELEAALLKRGHLPTRLYDLKQPEADDDESIYLSRKEPEDDRLYVDWEVLKQYLTSSGITPPDITDKFVFMMAYGGRAVVQNVTVPPYMLSVQGNMFDKREIGNEPYILSFLEGHKIAKWDATTQKFDRNGLVRTWTGCAETSIPRNIARVSRAYEKEVRDKELPFDSTPFSNNLQSSTISWLDFRKFFLPYLESGRQGPSGDSLIKLYKQKKDLLGEGVVTANGNTRLELDRNYLNISAAPAHQRDLIEGRRALDDEVGEAINVVPSEFIGSRTLPSETVDQVKTALNRDDIKAIEFYKVDKDAEVKIAVQKEITARHRTTEETKQKETVVKAEEAIAVEKAKEVLAIEKTKEAAEKAKEVLAIEKTKEVMAVEKAKEVLAIEKTKEVMAVEKAKEVVAIEKTKEVVATSAAAQAKHVADQKKYELDLARLKRGRVTDEEEENEDEEDADYNEEASSVKKKRPRRARASTATPRVRPRAGDSAITGREYTPDTLVDYLRRAFRDQTDMWKNSIWSHFSSDQDNPFMGFLPDHLGEQKTWLYGQLDELVRLKKLRTSIHIGLKSYSFVE